ncbi:oligoribonuclease, mitochondrial-like isoform X2 [Oppia nitens]|uniref:oligoribonuclease, mitochondrial-like isoform X2 n=1 Tax=Oppia nitens TaxID=1686743 RepID=UPI0023DB4313|nr:oligoribonuclease, mitochondrial-like isoform X2 [Oppia nitens]
MSARTLSSAVTSTLKNEFLGKKLVWVDCEMSGLDVNVDRLLEVAVVVTNGNLETIKQFGPFVIKTDKHILDSMNDWCVKTHNQTGLVKQCLESQLTVEEVDKKLYEAMYELNIKNGLLAGNSVSYDRLFLNKYLPKFASCLHYRTIDVSTIKELIRIWFKKDESFKKALTHRAIDDINESIAELKFYRQNYFINK